MKKKTLLSSILTIVLCLSLIAGSTFALFTDEASVDIEVDSGNAEIQAGLTSPLLQSVRPIKDGEIPTEFDENGKGYVYEDKGESFTNGGTAWVDNTNGIITLNNVTPGDKILFKLTGKNSGDVALEYRYKIECIDGFELMKGFVMTVEGTKYASMASYVSEWNSLAKGKRIDKIADANEEGVALALELPVSAGDEFQNKTAKIKITVEAVQSNADVSDTDKVEVKYITAVKDGAELVQKLASDEILHVFVEKNITAPVLVDFDMKNKTIDANGHNINLTFGKDASSRIKLENVVVKDLVAESITVKSGVSGDITLLDSKLSGANKLINGGGDADRLDKLSVTVENCELDCAGGNNAIYFYHVENLTIRDSKIKNSISWAVMINGGSKGNVRGNIVISDCTFESCKGLLKGAIEGAAGVGSLGGNFTFANNVITDCEKKESSTNSGNFVFMNLTPVNGTITFSNNAVDGVVVTVEDMGLLG